MDRDPTRTDPVCRLRRHSRQPRRPQKRRSRPVPQGQGAWLPFLPPAAPILIPSKWSSPDSRLICVPQRLERSMRSRPSATSATSSQPQNAATLSNRPDMHPAVPLPRSLSRRCRPSLVTSAPSSCPARRIVILTPRRVTVSCHAGGAQKPVRGKPAPLQAVLSKRATFRVDAGPACHQVIPSRFAGSSRGDGSRVACRHARRGGKR